MRHYLDLRMIVSETDRAYNLALTTRHDTQKHDPTNEFFVWMRTNTHGRTTLTEKHKQSIWFDLPDSDDGSVLAAINPSTKSVACPQPIDRYSRAPGRPIRRPG